MVPVAVAAVEAATRTVAAVEDMDVVAGDTKAAVRTYGWIRER